MIMWIVVVVVVALVAVVVFIAYTLIYVTSWDVIKFALVKGRVIAGGLAWVGPDLKIGGALMMSAIYF